MCDFMIFATHIRVGGEVLRNQFCFLLILFLCDNRRIISEHINEIIPNINTIMRSFTRIVKYIDVNYY